MTLELYKQKFIEFMVRSDVLTFGDFTTKSGRKTPFFINTGRYRTGDQFNRLAGFYADAVEARGIEFDFLFGPAYKGIPLVVGIAMELARRGRNVPFCFNRKEAKDHGEGGTLVGHVPQPGQRVLITEDVTTAGTSIRETVPLLRKTADVFLAGLVVSVDRMERGQGTRNALTELSDEFHMNTFSIVSIVEIAEYLRGRAVDGRVVLTEELFERIQAYRREYGGTE
ncbi:MAG: orotate phosphoribosyltransferase [Planctomycetaceae bacterium]|nr:orotate phosphoribosyltransferase [Planctomycetaceae bacterium]